MRRRALVLQPLLRPLGGAEGVAAWMLEALVPDCAVTLACRERPDLAAVDRRYGTSLRGSDLAIVVLPDLPAPRLRLDNLRSWWLQRRVRELARSFDLTICATGEADLGEGTIQYVHSVTRLYQARGGRDLGWFHASSLAGAAYLAASARLTGFDVARMRRNRTLVCSDWLGGLVGRQHGIVPTTLYPPAAGAFGDVPWGARADTAVWAGRLWPERRVELVIEIVERVRAMGLELRLELLGAVHDLGYVRHIRGLVRARAAWARLREDVDRDELCAAMSAARYGLHGTAEESFGMGPAELVRAGAILFVPDGGGQVELVGRDPRLMFHTAAEAATRLAAAMVYPGLQESLRAHLAPMRERLGSARFVRGLRELCGLPALSTA